jgi:hypothetical protein
MVELAMGGRPARDVSVFSPSWARAAGAIVSTADADRGAAWPMIRRGD